MLLLLSLVVGCWSLVVVVGMSAADAMYRVPTAYWLQIILKP